jgi:hypothetical protein
MLVSFLLITVSAQTACKYPRDFKRSKYYEIVLRDGQSHYEKLLKAAGNCWATFQTGKNNEIRFKFDQVSSYSQAKKNIFKN